MNIGIDIDDTITKTSEETDIYAKEYTENILKRKFELRIIAKITKEWLKRNKINYEKLYIGHKDKRKISEECKIDVFIDDSYKTCEQIAGLGIKTYMMDSRINKNLEEKNWKRVYSWKDFEKEMSILGQMS